ncbi:helix-turn-helix domain-containing protein [Aeromonas veronii]
MPTLHLLLINSLLGHCPYSEYGVLLTTNQVSYEGSVAFSYNGQQLQVIYRELQHLMTTGSDYPTFPRPLMIPMDLALLQTLNSLGQNDQNAMLRLVLAYALTVDRHNCSSLLRPLVAADAELFEMLHRHRLEPWPVSRYAALFGLSQRKFNQLFKEKFGMSAKHWLNQQRLEHARTLLATTSNKVIDIALESGFCNAAHFSDTFRRYFNQTPSEVRRGEANESLA